MTHSHLEWTLAHQIEAEGLPEPEREYKFHPKRKWRADFCWPDHRLIVEVEGGTRSGGRHTRPIGFEGDCEKQNAAELAGWTYLRFTGNMVIDGRAVTTIKEALEETMKLHNNSYQTRLRMMKLLRARRRGLITEWELERELAALEGKEPLSEREER